MDNNAAPPAWEKFKSLLREDTDGFHPRLVALYLAAKLLPRHAASEARARLFGLAGFRVGEGTRIEAPPKINGGAQLFSNLVIGRNCMISAECVFDLGEKITLGDRVTLSPGVMILTSTHELDIREHRAGLIQLNPVVIGDGAWVGARAIILPGVNVGAGAVVNPGSVVNKDVAAHTRVGGAPAAQLEKLDTHDAATS